MAFFLQAEITTLPKQGQVGMITTLTPQGPADTGYAGDYWQFNTKAKLARVHRQYRFTPSRTQCPVPAEQLEDYGRTTIRSKDGATNTFEDQHQKLGRAKQNTTENVERRNSIQDQERHDITRDTTETACNKDTAKKCTTSDPLQSNNTFEGENNTTNHTGSSSNTHR